MATGDGMAEPAASAQSGAAPVPGGTGSRGADRLRARHAGLRPPGSPGPSPKAGAPIPRGARGSYRDKWQSDAERAVFEAEHGKAELFNEQNSGRLMRSAFTIPAVWTGYPGWLLKPDEERELTGSAVVALNECVTVHPKWIALSLFGLSLSGLVVSKMLDQLAWRQAQAVRGGPHPKPESKKTEAPSAPPSPGPTEERKADAQAGAAPPASGFSPFGPTAAPPAAKVAE